jgi:putative DNA-invertase from lambdoid prophage Rac
MFGVLTYLAVAIPQLLPRDPIFATEPLMASLAEFERDLVRERVRSGVAAAKARGQKFGKRPGQRVKADKFGPKVLQMVLEGYSYRKNAEKLNLSKTTVNDIVKCHRQAGMTG